MVCVLYTARLKSMIVTCMAVYDERTNDEPLCAKVFWKWWNNSQFSFFFLQVLVMFLIEEFLIKSVVRVQHKCIQSLQDVKATYFERRNTST